MSNATKNRDADIFCLYDNLFLFVHLQFLFGQYMGIPIIENTGSRGHQAVEVFVFKCTVVWGWSGRDPHFIVLIVPPIPVTSTSGESLRSATRNSYFTRPCWLFMNKVLSLARHVGFQIGVKDKAAGNDKASSGGTLECHAKLKCKRV